jgi:hypothetical protein
MYQPGGHVPTDFPSPALRRLSFHSTKSPGFSCGFHGHAGAGLLIPACDLRERQPAHGFHVEQHFAAACVTLAISTLIIAIIWSMNSGAGLGCGFEARAHRPEIGRRFSPSLCGWLHSMAVRENRAAHYVDLVIYIRDIAHVGDVFLAIEMAGNLNSVKRRAAHCRYGESPDRGAADIHARSSIEG